MKKFLTLMLTVILALPCAILMTACGGDNQTDELVYAVYHQENLETYGIKEIIFTPSIEYGESYAISSIDDKVGVAKEDVTAGNLYVRLHLADNSYLGTLKMYVNGKEVALEEVESISEPTTCCAYKFDSIPTNAKITFSGEVSYYKSNVAINFGKLMDEYKTDENYLKAKLSLRIGDTYLIGSATEGVNYETFVTEYETIEKAWVLKDNLYISIYFDGKDRILNRSNIIQCDLACSRIFEDGVVTFEIKGNKDGGEISFNPNYLTDNTTKASVNVSFSNYNLTPDNISYIVDGSEYSIATYDQIKNATNIKIKFSLNEFLKTILTSGKTGISCNYSSLEQAVEIDGDYAFITVGTPWAYYYDGLILNNYIGLLSYNFDCYSLYDEVTQEWYSIDDIFGENANLKKIEFSGVNNLNTDINNVGYQGGVDFETDFLYLDIAPVGNNYFIEYANGTDFSIKCRMEYYRGSYGVCNDFKNVKITINGTKEVVLTYDSEWKLATAVEGVTVTKLMSSSNELVEISFSGMEIESISFEAVDKE